MEKHTLKTKGSDVLLQAEGASLNAILWLNGIDWETLPQSSSGEMSALVQDLRANPDRHPANTPTSRQRVLSVMILLKELQKLLAKQKRWSGTFGDPPEGWKAAVQLAEEINERLEKYQQRMAVQVILRAKKSSSLAYDGIALPVRHRPMGEAWAMKSVVRVAQLGFLDRIRPCNCGQFFFAKRKDAKFCSATCYRRQYEGSDEFRKKKREYNHQHYRDVVKTGIQAIGQDSKRSKYQTTARSD